MHDQSSQIHNQDDGSEFTWTCPKPTPPSAAGASYIATSAVAVLTSYLFSRA